MKLVLTSDGKLRVSESDKKLLLYFSILPNRYFSFIELIEYLQIREDRDVEFFDILHDLNKKGFIERDGKFYRLVPLSRTTIVRQLKPTYKECKAPITYFSNKLFVKEGETYSSKEYLIPFIDSILTAIRDPHPEIIRLTINYAIVLSQLNQKHKALEINLLAIEYAESTNYRFIERAYQNAAELYYEMKNYRKSVEYSLLFVYLKERTATKLPELQELANHYYNIAVMYYDMVDFTNAKRYIDKVVELDKKILDEEHPNFLYDLKLQKRIHFAYGISRHIYKYIKIYMLLLLLFLIIAIYMLLRNFF